MRSQRRIVLVAAIGVLIAVLAANVAGLVRYPGGPLREPNADGWFWLDTRPADQGINEEGIMSGAGVMAAEPIYTGIALQNAWSETAVVERVRLLNATPGLNLVEARLVRPGAADGAVGLLTGSQADLAGVRLHDDYQLLPAQLAGGSTHVEGRMWVEVMADTPGEYSFESIAVDYRVGPFTFTIVLHQALKVCLVPLPAGMTCSVDSE